MPNERYGWEFKEMPRVKDGALEIKQENHCWMEKIGEVQKLQIYQLSSFITKNQILEMVLFYVLM